jgi:pilus assembly protein CpaF
MVPPRPTGSYNTANPARKSGTIPFSQTQSFEALKTRALAKLEDRLDLGASKRMPASLLRQSIRTHAEQVVDQEARGLPRSDRDRLIDEVLAELLGYGPLDVLFKDHSVREIMVTGPHAVIVRREQGQWLPTSIKYRDEDHVRWSLDKLATHADPVGGIFTSINLFDLQLPNGFRAVAIIPPPALGQPATVAFFRTEAIPATTEPTESVPAPLSGRYPPSPTTSASAATSRPAPGTIKASPRPGSGIINTPPPRGGSSESTSMNSPDLLAPHRNRIIERLITKLANLGVYDLQRVELTELRKVVTAYVREYVEKEKIYLSEVDQCRLMLEILTAMQR